MMPLPLTPHQRMTISSASAKVTFNAPWTCSSASMIATAPHIIASVFAVYKLCLCYSRWILVVSAIIPLHQRYIQLFRYYPALLLSSYSAIIQLFRYYPALLLLLSSSPIIKLFIYYPALPAPEVRRSSRLSPEVRRVSASWTTHELEPLSLLRFHTSGDGYKAGKLNSRD